MLYISVFLSDIDVNYCREHVMCYIWLLFRDSVWLSVSLSLGKDKNCPVPTTCVTKVLNYSNPLLWYNDIVLIPRNRFTFFVFSTLFENKNIAKGDEQVPSSHLSLEECRSCLVKMLCYNNDNISLRWIQDNNKLFAINKCKFNFKVFRMCYRVI